MTQTLREKKKHLGGRIHKILNHTLERKLTKKEYTQLIFLIAGVFDLITKIKE